MLKNTKAEYVLYNQLLRSGTSIGALIREAEFARSKANFINKLSVALKEANETAYWIEILVRSHYLNDNAHKDTCRMLNEIIRMFIASIKTAKGNNS